MSTLVSGFLGRLRRLTRYVEHPGAWRLRRYGVSVDLYERYNQPWLAKANINTVIDVGANTGQFAQLMATLLPHAVIYSFEPLPDCFARLQAETRNVPNVKSFNVGLGSKEAMLTIHRNPFSPSSSFRPMADLHRQHFPYTSGPETHVHVPVRRLDSFGHELPLKEGILIKMDVQGYEDEVLDGGQEIVSQASMVIIEVSFAPLYEGQPSFDDLYTRMKKLGFTFSGCIDQLIGPLDGAIVQADALFTRSR